MTELESQVYKEWQWEKRVIGGTESGTYYEWGYWGEWQEEDEALRGPWIFWGRGFREGDVLFIGPYKVLDELQGFDSVEEADEYRDSLPVWDRTRYVDDGSTREVYDTLAGAWVTRGEMDKDTMAAIEAVWERAPFWFVIQSDGSMRPPEHWQRFSEGGDGQGSS